MRHRERRKGDMMTDWQRGCGDGWEAAERGQHLNDREWTNESQDYREGFVFGWEERADEGNLFVKVFQDKSRSDAYVWERVS